MAYSVGNLDALTSVIIPFFETHPLRTSKSIRWTHFREMMQTLQNKTKTVLPEIEAPITASWLLGFMDGDGCFTVSIGAYVAPQFVLGVHQEDFELCERIRAFLECGVVYRRKSGFVIYQISRRADLIHRLFPLLFTHRNCHCLRTQKRHSASLFRRIVLALEQQKHKLPEGMKQIRAWKARMSALKVANIHNNTEEH